MMAKERLQSIIKTIKKPEKLLDNKAFILEGITGVSAKIAKDLLSHFGSVKAVVNATEEELKEVNGIGKEKAKKIFNLFQ